MSSSEAVKADSIKQLLRERSLPALPFTPPTLWDEYDQEHSTPFRSSLGEEGLYEEIQQVLKKRGHSSSRSTPSAQPVSIYTCAREGARERKGEKRN